VPGRWSKNYSTRHRNGSGVEIRVEPRRYTDLIVCNNFTARAALSHMCRRTGAPSGTALESAHHNA
jgi:hypothetical protein